jgi:autotransporter-associated beta strand protein
LDADGVGSDLSITLGYTPSIGQQFTLIDNDGTDAVVGTFNGYAEGSLIAANNVALRITYSGGTGNDVVLTRVPAGFWSGGAGAGNKGWRTAANWVDGVVPSAGYPLFFPAGPTQTSTVNNFAAGTSFESISIAGWGYTLAGNKIDLWGGLFDTGGDATVSLPITLRAAQSLISKTGVLNVGAIHQNGYQLTLAADAYITVNGKISGAGGVVKAGGGIVILAKENTYTGTTLVEHGELWIRNSKSLGAANGKIETGTTLDDGTLVLDGALKVTNELLTLSGNGAVRSVGANVWTGDVDIQGDTRFDVNYGQSLQVSGRLTNAGGRRVEVNGGLLELSGTSNFNGGQFHVYSGSLQIDRRLTGLDYLGVAYGASLLGAGTVGASFVEVMYGGVLKMSGAVNSSRLDVVYASMDPAGTTGTASLRTGSINLYESTFAVQLNSSGRYDQLKVNGSVDLSGTDLQVTLGYTPKIGQKFTLVDNDGTDPIVGIFDGYAEGDLVLVGDTAFRISYSGGTGNDVVLTRFAGASLHNGVLFVFGTSNNDNVRIDFKEKRGVFEVKSNLATNEKQRFNAADVQLIHVVLGSGDDCATVGQNISVPTILDGGDGNDHLTAGGGDAKLFGGRGNDDLRGDGGNDLLIGGDGADRLTGGAGHNVLIGGAGKDLIKGGEGNDLLIGSSTNYDLTETALDGIMAEWTSDHDYLTAVANLRGTGSREAFSIRSTGAHRVLSLKV